MSDLSLLQEKTVTLFNSTYKSSTSESLTAGYAPGRVNLIGEHTDYNNGYVFPMALANMGTIAVGRRTDKGEIKIVTSAEVTPNTFQYKPGKSVIEEVPQWARYVVGVVKCFEEVSSLTVSVDLALSSNLPMGAGLSSSASLEVAVFSLLERLYNVINISKIEKIKACQKAEHKFANVPCGIMDQFIATLGDVDHALFINCHTNEFEKVPFGDKTLLLVVTDTHKKHELAGGEYAKRRATCEAVAKSIGVPSLGEVHIDQLVKHFCKPGSDNSHLPDKSYPRSRHVVTEIARAKKAKECLVSGDITLFGQLMNQSHKSLADDYQVTCSELDEVVRVAWETEGVVGSRMTGGGFGGCAITLVKRDAEKVLLDRLNKLCPYSSSFSTTAGSGAHSWDIGV